MTTTGKLKINKNNNDMSSEKMISRRYTNELENSRRHTYERRLIKGYITCVHTYSHTRKTYVTHATSYICSVVACVNKDSLIGKLVRI